MFNFFRKLYYFQADGQLTTFIFGKSHSSGTFCGGFALTVRGRSNDKASQKGFALNIAEVCSARLSQYLIALAPIRILLGRGNAKCEDSHEKAKTQRTPFVGI